MPRRRLLWQLFPSYLLITLLSLIAVAWYGSRAAQQAYHRHTADDLAAMARLVTEEATGYLAGGNLAGADSVAKALGAASAVRVTVILPSGVVAGDSQEDPRHMDNHADRPEVAAALAGRRASATRYSYTLKREMMYVAVPVRAHGALIGVVRTSMAMRSIEAELLGFRRRIAVAGIIIAALAAAMSLAISRHVARPLEEMRRAAVRFAAGDLTKRLPTDGAEEIAGLAEALNRMAAQLADRISALGRERNEQQAMLASMVEGVLAVDADERVMSMNAAAGRLLGADPAEAPGRLIQEVTRSMGLQRLVGATLASQKPVEGDVVFPDEPERHLQAHGTVLHDVHGGSIGALVVLEDVTHVRRLERVRSEFVANVSHELRTPITSIKGFIETLLEGALDSPGDARRFVEIIARQADRLNSIVEDLLSLSRIEQEAERGAVALETDQVVPTLRLAAQFCEAKAEAKDIRLVVDCPDDLRAAINGLLLEQAVANLIDNAVKFSDPGHVVEILGEQAVGDVLIRVRDEGCGIEERHLSRIFERFYRVDRARSRDLGGTGLGLAIVKHIAQAHGGGVSVESAPGVGSTFTIRLPARPRPD